MALLMSACTSSCEGAATNASTTGELGNGTFEYSCGGASDPVCELGVVDQPFPSCIAKGGTFGLDYTLRDISELDDDELASFLHVDAASDTFVSGGNGSFRAEQEGRVALLALDHEKVVDLIHLRIVTPDGMDVQAVDPADSVDELRLAQGDVARFRVFPRSTTCPSLGGAVELEATSTDDVIVRASADDVLLLRAHSPGRATVTLRMGELTQEIHVEVVGGPRRNKPDEPGSSSGDEPSSSDGGSESSGESEGSESGGSSSEGTGA
ncbi:MAG: hypothetical protein IAG13_18025 [Deltaproteobacteria bacterium]|nr:hypothetical protein [Nannocystaceae bacterium]